MQPIENNPYRTLGLLAGASDRDILSRTTRLKKYISVGQAPDEDFYFPVLAPLQRTAQGIDAAAAKLNHQQDKLEAALFWFIKAGIVDEPAIDQLLENKIVDAETTWARVAKKGDDIEVNSRNFSAYQNLSTLKLSLAFAASAAIDAVTLSEGILLKLKLLDSDCYKNFVAHVCDANYKTNPADLQVLFLTQIQREVGKRGFPTGQFISILSGITFAAREGFLNEQGGNFVGTIEELMEEAKQKRKTQPKSAHTAGKKLFEQARDPLAQLQVMVGKNDLKFTNTSDKVALEVMQCGIEYFNFHHESESVDPGQGAMDCLKKAKSIAILKSTQDRCQENIENVQSWIDEKPQRDRMKVVHTDLNSLVKLLDQYENSSTIQAARQFLNLSRPHLTNIRAQLGSTDEFYLGVSTRVGSQAFGMVVDEINAVQKAIPITPQHQMRGLIERLQNYIAAALEVINTISKQDLLPAFRKQLQDNYGTLQGMQNNLRQPASGGSGGGGGCYIATLVYGSYEHPQVWVLRRFRDDVLASSAAGQWFIRQYYRFSPGLVQGLRNRPLIQQVIRFLLNQFIKSIKK